jgi:predicted P-loop ATPase
MDPDNGQGFVFTVLTNADQEPRFAAKRIRRDKEVGYDKGKNWTFRPYSFPTHQTFAAFLTRLARDPLSCIVRGAIAPGLDPGKPHRRLWATRDEANSTLIEKPRHWSVWDFDDVQVPPGLGAPTELRAAAGHVRDTLMPPEFRDARCVVTASAGTGRKGDAITRMRLYFLHPLACDNPTLKTYAKGVAAKLKLPIDPCVFQPGQPIYTARPLFEDGLKDPVPEADWAFMLDGAKERVELELAKYVKEGKKVEEFIAKSEKISGGDWRDLARRIVGCRDGLVGDISGTFHEPLIKVIGLAVHTRDSDDEIIAFLMQLIAERGGRARQTTYDTDWLRDAVEWCRERDAGKPGRPGGEEPNFLRNKNGALVANHANLITLLRSDPEFQERFAYNELGLVVDVLKPIPSLRPQVGKERFPHVLTDNDISLVLDYIQHRELNIQSRETVISAIEQMARERNYHPFRDYLEGTKWDGTVRVDNLFPVYFGASDPDKLEVYVLASRYFMLGLVKRAYEPGCQNDYVPVLESRIQGRQKTKGLELLGGKFFGGGPPPINSKDFKQYLAGKMLIELADLDALKRVEISAVKRVVTEKEDDYRPPYGRLFRKVPRSAVFAATTNEDDWNKDYTGARRFWPIVCGRVDLEKLRTDRDQLFAEAVVRYKNGERSWPTPEEEEKLFAPEQEARYAESDWLPAIAQWILDREPKGGWENETPPGFTGMEVAQGCLGFEAKEYRKADQNEVRRCLMRLKCYQPQKSDRRYWLPPKNGINKVFQKDSGFSDKEAGLKPEEKEGEVVPFPRPTK